MICFTSVGVTFGVRGLLWVTLLVPGPVLCQDFAANHGLLPTHSQHIGPSVAILGRWRQLCSATCLCRAENGAERGAWFGVTMALGQTQGLSQLREPREKGNQLGAARPPKGGGGVGHAWAGKCGQRGRQHTWQPAAEPASPDSKLS